MNRNTSVLTIRSDWERFEAMPNFDPYHKWLGIPPNEQPPNHYRLLGISLFEADPDVIDAAADQRMTFVRQCASGPHLAASQKLLNELAAARLCLLSPEAKVAYDQALMKGPARKSTKSPLDPVSRN